MYVPIYIYVHAGPDRVGYISFSFLGFENPTNYLLSRGLYRSKDERPATLKQHRDVFRKIGTAYTQGKTGTMMYLGAVHRLRVGASIIFSWARVHRNTYTDTRQSKLDALENFESTLRVQPTRHEHMWCLRTSHSRTLFEEG